MIKTCLLTISVDKAVEQSTHDKIELVPTFTHNIEFLLDQTPSNVGQISNS